MQLLTRLERLDRLESWLKADDTLILRDAAQELGVSLRTIHRDLHLLRERGVPVESERGRGGGVRVSTGWGIGRIALSRAEALDVLVALALGDVIQGALQMGHAAAIRRKLLGTFSHAEQRRINAMRKRIRIGTLASSTVVETLGEISAQVGDELKEAFALHRGLEMQYRDRFGQQTFRRVDLHFLILNPPIWYALGWDHLRNDLRAFRCDRIEDARVTATIFTPRPWSDVADRMDGNWTREV